MSASPFCTHRSRRRHQVFRRKDQRKSAALTRRALDADGAAHGVYESFADRQAQARSLVAVALGISQLEKLVENIALGFGRNPDAGVDDADFDSVAIGHIRLDANAPVIGELDGIAD